MPSLTVMPNSPTPADEAISLPPNIPSLPDDVKNRFGSMQDWEEEIGGWWHQVSGQLQNLIPSAAAAINNVGQSVASQIKSFSSSLQQVSTVVGGKNAIYVQSSAPVSPNLDDLWVDTSSGNQFKFWDGTLWQYYQDQVLAAAISTESTTRATADGFLSAKYTLTVVAGNVVTGMNITSSTGSGTNISSVTFNAADFLIYNGTSGVAIFEVVGGNVFINGNATVAGEVDIGTGLIQTKITSSGFTFGDPTVTDIVLSATGSYSYMAWSNTLGDSVTIATTIGINHLPSITVTATSGANQGTTAIGPSTIALTGGANALTAGYLSSSTNDGWTPQMSAYPGTGAQISFRWNAGDSTLHARVNATDLGKIQFA